jgi:hypothetical protein
MLKDELVDAMIAVHGAHYTIGWLAQAYKCPVPADIDIAVVTSTLETLKQQLAQKVKDNSYV